MAVMTRPVRFIGLACWLFWRATRGVILRFWQNDPLVYASTAAAISRSLWAQLPIITAMAALVGALTGLLAGQILSVYKAELLIMAAMTDALFQHILPLVIGIFASGSTAVDIATRMAAMGLANEIEALESMGQDPAAFALGPALVGVMIANPPQVAIAAVVSLLAANIAVVATANIDLNDLYILTLTDRSGLALLTGLGKTTLFSIIAFATGAAIGSLPVRVPAEIGTRASEAFRIGLLTILSTATIWVALS